MVSVKQANVKLFDKIYPLLQKLYEFFQLIHYMGQLVCLNYQIDIGLGAGSRILKLDRLD